MARLQLSVDHAWVAQRSENSWLLAVHRAMGDDVSLKRLVIHSASFSRQGSYECFRADRRQEGFDTDFTQGSATWRVIFVRDEPIAETYIHRVTDELVAASHALGGEYLGWQAFARTC